MKPKVELGPKRAFLKARSMYFHYLYISSSFCYIFSLHIMIIPKLQKSNCSSTTFSWQNNPFFKLPTVQHHSFLPLQGKSQVSQRVGATYTTLIAFILLNIIKIKIKQHTKLYSKHGDLLQPNIVPRSQTMTFEFPANLTFSAEFIMTCAF